jgi:hypothetical protein
MSFTGHSDLCGERSAGLVSRVNNICFGSGLVDEPSIMGDGLFVTHGRFRGTFLWF